MLHPEDAITLRLNPILNPVNPGLAEAATLGSVTQPLRISIVRVALQLESGPAGTSAPFRKSLADQLRGCPHGNRESQEGSKILSGRHAGNEETRD